MQNRPDKDPLFQTMYCRPTYNFDRLRLSAIKADKTPLKMVQSRFEPQPQQKMHHHYPKIPSDQKRMVHITSQQIMQLKQSMLNANISFINSLIDFTADNFINFEPNEYITVNHDQILLIISGQIKFTTNLDRQFSMKQGFIFFISSSFHSKIKHVISSSRSIVFSINKYVFNKAVFEALCIKNIEKIQCLKKCRFTAQWDLSLMQDMATSMQLIHLEKDFYIYEKDDPVDYLYFVKQGIVMLQRTSTIQNPLYFNYQQNYQSNIVNQAEVMLFVRKSMSFGEDGLCLEPYNKRLYSAKTMSSCEIYRIKATLASAVSNLRYLRQEGRYLSSSYLAPINSRKLPSKELNRICDDYANIIVNKKLILKKSLRNIELEVNISRSRNSSQLKNVREIQKFQQQVRRLTVASHLNRVPKSQTKFQYKAKADKNPEQSVPLHALRKTYYSASVETIERKPVKELIDIKYQTNYINRVNSRQRQMVRHQKKNKKQIDQKKQKFDEQQIGLNIITYRNIKSSIKVGPRNYFMDNPQRMNIFT